MSTKPKTVEAWMRANGREPYEAGAGYYWRDAATPGSWGSGSRHLLPAQVFANLRSGDTGWGFDRGSRRYATLHLATADLEQALIAAGEIVLAQPDVHVNAAGGKQSAIPTRFDLMPPDAMIQVAEVLARGAHYGADNWRLIPKRDHLNHALLHLAMHLKGDTSETHLANAACRLLFAIEAPNEVPNADRTTTR